MYCARGTRALSTPCRFFHASTPLPPPSLFLPLSPFATFLSLLLTLDRFSIPSRLSLSHSLSVSLFSLSSVSLDPVLNISKVHFSLSRSLAGSVKYMSHRFRGRQLVVAPEQDERRDACSTPRRRSRRIEGHPRIKQPLCRLFVVCFFCPIDPIGPSPIPSGPVKSVEFEGRRTRGSGNSSSNSEEQAGAGQAKTAGEIKMVAAAGKRKGITLGALVR